MELKIYYNSKLRQSKYHIPMLNCCNTHLILFHCTVKIYSYSIIWNEIHSIHQKRLFLLLIGDWMRLNGKWAKQKNQSNNSINSLAQREKNWLELFVGLAAEHLAPWGGVSFTLTSLTRLIHSIDSKEPIPFLNSLTFRFVHFTFFVVGLFFSRCLLSWAEPLAGSPAHNPPIEQSERTSQSIKLMPQAKKASKSIHSSHSQREEWNWFSLFLLRPVSTSPN